MAKETQKKDGSGIQDNENFIIRALYKSQRKAPTFEQIGKAMKKHFSGYSVERIDGSMVFHFDCHKFVKGGSAIVPCFAIFEGGMPVNNQSKNKKEELVLEPVFARLLGECKLQFSAVELNTNGMDTDRKAVWLAECATVFAELFSDCDLIQLLPFGTCMTVDKILKSKAKGTDRFIDFLVKPRLYFLDAKKSAMIVDTVGMGYLGLPDMQYHFSGVDATNVIAHALVCIRYIIAQKNPIHDGDTIDGFDEKGAIKANLQWKCSYEGAIVYPERRKVINVEIPNHSLR